MNFVGHWYINLELWIPLPLYLQKVSGFWQCVEKESIEITVGNHVVNQDTWSTAEKSLETSVTFNMPKQGFPDRLKVIKILIVPSPKPCDIYVSLFYSLMHYQIYSPEGVWFAHAKAFVKTYKFPLT